MSSVRRLGISWSVVSVISINQLKGPGGQSVAWWQVYLTLTFWRPWRLGGNLLHIPSQQVKPQLVTCLHWLRASRNAWI